MGSFHAQIARFAEQTQQKADKALRAIALQTLIRVQKKSPVDTGQLRRSWTVALNGFPSSYKGSDTVPSNAKFGDVIVIATNKPYAPMLEYGLYPNPPKKPTGKTKNGYSIQAPNGMVRITVQEMRAFIRNNPQLGVS
ncbi:HK97 gp10 family phage protein [Mannheimia pernigra]|uniref:HK97 gp10 family phage protein n=1 Tax=Mannheimia pernigra TaxID=111844 RepID=UPI00159F4C9A|nr:HK97 gp10 family phage protein [Mannheimia pernigra]QLB44475.1 HK97 gp10 family phage protein [Mannheimia pernigra]